MQFLENMHSAGWCKKTGGSRPKRTCLKHCQRLGRPTGAAGATSQLVIVVLPLQPLEICFKNPF